MSDTVDFKKLAKELYLPKTTPAIVDVPAMTFIMVDGQGDPNTAASFQNAMEILYGLSYSIKMSKMTGRTPAGYFDYVVPPLEGLWSVDGVANFRGYKVADKNALRWTSMIRQPDFVTPAVFAEVQQSLGKKKPHLDTSLARLEVFAEGLCAQVMHIGAYDDEAATIDRLEQFITKAGYTTDISAARRHHEIYLSDPRKTPVEKLKTVIRHPVRR